MSIFKSLKEICLHNKRCTLISFKRETPFTVIVKLCVYNIFLWVEKTILHILPLCLKFPSAIAFWATTTYLLWKKFWLFLMISINTLCENDWTFFLYLACYISYWFKFLVQLVCNISTIRRVNSGSKGTISGLPSCLCALMIS